MIETLLFVRLGEGEVCRYVVWKLQKCFDRVGGGDVDMNYVIMCSINVQLPSLA